MFEVLVFSFAPWMTDIRYIAGLLSMAFGAPLRLQILAK